MEIQAYRDQERDLRDQLQEAIKAQATAQAELAKSQDEAASNFHFADYAAGQVEYRSWVLHDFGEALDNAQVRVRDRIRDVDRHFQESFSYAQLAPDEVLPEADVEFPRRE